MNTRKLRAKTLKLLHQALPGLPVRYDILVVPPTEHLLRCFLFEGTLDTGKVYFWRVVMPLYRPVRSIILNYGDRLLEGEQIDLAELDLDRLIRVISERELQYLEGIRSPKDFLERIDWKSRPTSPNYRLDFALSCYMAGDASACLEILEELTFAKLRPVWAETVKLAREIAEELKTDRPTLDRRIEAWERRNIEIFDLGPRRRRNRTGPI